MKLKDRYLKKTFLGLQFFAEGDPTTPPTTDPVDPPGEPQGLTPEQVNKIIQDRLAKEQAKWAKKLEEETKEAQRLANLNAEQRKQEELNKRIKELEEREAALQMQENKMETSKVLKDRGLSEAFVDFVIGTDNEATLERINALEVAFKEAVKVEVDKRIPSTDPQGSGAGGATGMTKEEFKKLPWNKQADLLKAEPEKYNKLLMS